MAAYFATHGISTDRTYYAEKLRPHVVTLFRLVCYLERQVVALQHAGSQLVLEDLARRVARLEGGDEGLAELEEVARKLSARVNRLEDRAGIA